MKPNWTAHGHRNFRRVRKFLSTSLWVGAGASVAGLILISCSGMGGAVFAPPAIPGAELVGMEACADCHDELVVGFKTSDHARLMAKGPNSPDLGCEGCHGAGSKHVESGGGAGTIINPQRSPEACFRCHLDKKAEFHLPYSHPVLGGQMSCGDCHDPHTGSSHKGGGTLLASANDTCYQCHSQQSGPFVFEHEATREGCVSCHNPHGSPNQKMLTERNSTLCLKCHFQDQTGSSATSIQIGGSGHGSSRLRVGTCWTAGCHEGIHGSNVDRHLRH